MSEIILSAAIRSNVLTLQKIGNQQSTIQHRLATGLKVSSAIDDPRNFFQAQGLNNRASDLTRRLDGMGLAIKTFEAADKGIKAITKIAENMAAIARQARDTSPADTEIRTTLMNQFNELKKQMAEIAQDSGFNGINLLGGDTLEVIFDERGNKKLVVNETDPVNYTGLDGDGEYDADLPIVGINLAAAWDDDGTYRATLDTVLDELDGAINELRTQAAVFGTNLTLVRIREEFTKEMVNTLKAGADGLVLADQNEEAANLLALNTRQQLSQQALALASQSEQSILRLLG